MALHHIFQRIYIQCSPQIQQNSSSKHEYTTNSEQSFGLHIITNKWDCLALAWILIYFHHSFHRTGLRKGLELLASKAVYLAPWL